MTDTEILDYLDTQLGPNEVWFIRRDTEGMFVVACGQKKLVESRKLPWWPRFRDAAKAAKSRVDLLQAAMEGPEENTVQVQGILFTTSAFPPTFPPPKEKPNPKLTHP